MSEYRVLVPLDGSRLAEHALIYLDALRSMGESRVLLLSVVEEAEGRLVVVAVAAAAVDAEATLHWPLRRQTDAKGHGALIVRDNMRPLHQCALL